MPKTSAGIVLYRRRERRLEVFLVHPGGPFWKNKDAGSWSIPKGEYVQGEDALAAAKREFVEETGFDLPSAECTPLGEIKQAGGKLVTAWAMEGDCEADEVKSNLFSMEWPPKSDRMQEFPEVDKAAWFAVEAAREKLLLGQRVFLDRLKAIA